MKITIFILVLVLFTITTSIAQIPAEPGVTYYGIPGSQYDSFQVPKPGDPFHYPWTGEFWTWQSVAFKFEFTASSDNQGAAVNIFGVNIPVCSQYYQLDPKNLLAPVQPHSPSVTTVHADIVTARSETYQIFISTFGPRRQSEEIRGKGGFSSTVLYSHYDNFRDYKTNDTRYADLPYSKVPGATFRMKSHMLLAMCNVLYRTGPEQSYPVVVNNWLIGQKYGYIGLVPNALEVCRYANNVRIRTYPVVLYPNIDIDRALSCDEGPISCVNKTDNQWVTIEGITIFANAGWTHRVNDPDGDRNMQFLKLGGGNPFSLEDHPLYIPKIGDAIYGSLKFSRKWGIFSDSDVPMTVASNMVSSAPMTVVDVLNPVPVTVTDTKMIFTEGESITVKVDVPTSVLLLSYTGANCDLSTENTINFTGPTTLHMKPTMENLFNVPDNDMVIVNSGIITARISTTEMFIQSSDRIPAIRVQSTTGIPGQTIKSLVGIMHTDINGKYIVASEILLDDIAQFEASPVAVTIRDLPSTKGVLARIIGKITSKSFDSFELDNSLRVFGNISNTIGERVVVDGIYCGNKFYIQ